MGLDLDMRENIIEAVAQIIDPAEWDFCDMNGRKRLINSVPRWQRQAWCKRSMAKARRIVSLLEPSARGAGHLRGQRNPGRDQK